jgi:HSP20 family protein
MNTKDNQSTKSTDVTLRSSSSNLFPSDEFDSFFNDFLSRKWPRLFDLNFPATFEKSFPKVDIIDHDNEIEVQAALPGVKKEDLEVSIDNQLITIRASTSTEQEKKEEGKYFRREISRGTFQRTLPLPENADNENAKASFENGILTVKIPKTEKSTRKRIEVK